MTGHPRNDGNCSPGSADVDLEMLQGAQAYLTFLHLHQVPSSESVEAWQRFYLVCDPLLRRFAFSCQVLRDDLDDCVQASWKEVTLALPKFHDDGQPRRFLAWLHLIVHSKAMDLRRYGARHPSRSLPWQVAMKLPSEDADPDSEPNENEDTARVQRVLAELSTQSSDISYRVFQLRSIEGRSVGEVAQELSLTKEQVRYRCCRMRRKFRGLYGVYLEREASRQDVPD